MRSATASTPDVGDEVLVSCTARGLRSVGHDEVGVVEEISDWDETPGGQVLTCRVEAPSGKRLVRVWTDDAGLTWIRYPRRGRGRSS